MSTDYGYELWALVVFNSLLLVFTVLSRRAAELHEDPWKIPMGGMLDSASGERSSQ